MKCHGVWAASSIKGKRNKDHFRESYEAMETAEIADSRIFGLFWGYVMWYNAYLFSKEFLYVSNILRKDNIIKS